MNCLDDWKTLNIRNKDLFYERWGASAIDNNRNIILFGGYSNKLKEIKFEKGPSKRSNFSSVKYLKENGEPYLIIHGGINENGELNDTYELNLNNFIWNEIEIQGQIPSCSTEHSAEIYKEFMIVIGGEINDDLHDKIRILNLKMRTWKSFKPSVGFNQNLFMRIFHSSAIVDSKLFIYSGADTAYFCYNDMVEIDFKDFDFDKNSNIANIQVISYDDFQYGNRENNNLNSKHSIIDKNSRYPYPRWGANMLVKNSDCLILFGGRNKKDFNDLWLYSITMKKWFEIKCFGNKTQPKRRAASVLVNNLLFVFGGFQDVFLSDINMINLNHLDFYKSYIDKNLLQITRPPTGEKINFVLEREKVSLSKSFFYKKIQMVNEKISVPINSNNEPINQIFNNKIQNVSQMHLHNFGLNLEKESSNFSIMDVSKNKDFSVRSLMLFYEISFLGKLISYVNVKDLENLIEISKFFNQTTIKIKLSNILSGIYNLYSQEYNNIDVNCEIFNLGFNHLKDSRNYFSNNFYNLKNKFCPERDYLKIHSKLLLKQIDSSNCCSDFFLIVREEIFKYLLNYIYNGSFPVVHNKEINIYLEMLLYAKFFKIKSLFKEIQYKINQFISIDILPIVVLFAVKLKAEVLLFHIAVKILLVSNLKNWKEYFSDHFRYLTDNLCLTNTFNSINKVIKDHNIYFHLLRISEKNNSLFFSPIKKESSFVDISKFNDFILEKIFEKSLRSIPNKYLNFYSGKNTKETDFSDNLKSSKMNILGDKQIILSLDLYFQDQLIN